jgi:hypothetical protein
MNINQERLPASEQINEGNKEFGDIDYPPSDTIKDVEVETLRSEHDDDVAVESGIRDKDPNQIAVWGTVPLSSDVPLINIRTEAEPVSTTIKPVGFEAKAVPEWEMRVRGTVQDAGDENLPPYTESIAEEDEEQKAA